MPTKDFLKDLKRHKRGLRPCQKQVEQEPVVLNYILLLLRGVIHAVSSPYRSPAKFVSLPMCWSCPPLAHRSQLLNVQIVCDPVVKKKPLMLCARLNWGGMVWGRMDTCICMTGSLCSSPEPSTLLIRKHPNIKSFFFKLQWCISTLYKLY